MVNILQPGPGENEGLPKIQSIALILPPEWLCPPPGPPLQRPGESRRNPWPPTASPLDAQRIASQARRSRLILAPVAIEAACSFGILS